MGSGTQWELGANGKWGWEPNGKWGWGPNGNWQPMGTVTQWEVGPNGKWEPMGIGVGVCRDIGMGTQWEVLAVGRCGSGPHLHHDVLHVVVLLGVQEGGELLLGGRHVAVAVGHLEAPLVPHHHLLVVEAVVRVGVVCGAGAN